SWDWLANEGTNASPETRRFITDAVGDAGDTIVPNQRLNLGGIVIVDSLKDFKIDGLKGIRGVVLYGPDYLATEDFKKELEYFLGRPLTYGRINRIRRRIGDSCAKRGHPAMDVWLPDQVMHEGTIQLLVKPPGKSGEPQ